MGVEVSKAEDAEPWAWRAEVSPLGHTTSVDHLQVSMGNPLEIPAGFLPVALDQIVPTGQGGSG